MKSTWKPIDVAGLRERLDMTQEELARALDVTVSTVCRWENGHARPSKLAGRALDALAARVQQPTA